MLPVFVVAGAIVVAAIVVVNVVVGIGRVQGVVLGMYGCLRGCH